MADQRVIVLSELVNIYQTQPKELFNAFQIGFNNAASSGPLCEEPMQGVCFIIDHIEIVKEQEETLDKEESKTTVNTSELYGPF